MIENIMYIADCIKKVIELWSTLARSIFNIQEYFFPVGKTSVTVMVKFEEKLLKYELDKKCRSKSHIFTVGNSLKFYCS